jgi:hypothetical protein
LNARAHTRRPLPAHGTTSCTAARRLARRPVSARSKRQWSEPRDAQQTLWQGLRQARHPVRSASVLVSAKCLAPKRPATRGDSATGRGEYRTPVTGGAVRVPRASRTGRGDRRHERGGGTTRGAGGRSVRFPRGPAHAHESRVVNVTQGDVWWADLPDTAGSGPGFGSVSV